MSGAHVWMPPEGSAHDSTVTRLCICDICICVPKQHHCPASPIPIQRYDNLKSTYGDAFKGGPCKAPTRAKPQQHGIGFTGPFDGTTTNRGDFLPWDNSRRQIVKPPSATLGADKHPFDGASVTRTDFAGTRGLPAEPHRPQVSAFVTDAPFDGNTTQRQDFTSKGYHKRSPYKPPVARDIKPEDREFMTEAGANFRDKGPARREKVKPPASSDVLKGKGPFDHNSTTRTDFKPHNVEPPRAYRPTDALHTQPEDRDFRTEARRHFTGQRASPVQRVKPPPDSTVLGLPFEGRSTLRSDFTSYPGAKPATPYKPTVSVLDGEEGRDFQSESRDQYKPKGIAKREAFKPETSVLRSGPWNASSTQRLDYPGWEGIKPATPYKPRQVTTDEKEDRSFLTEAGSQFADKGFIPNPRVRAAPTITEHRPFNANSTHREDFPVWGTRPRTPFKPAHALHTGPEDRDFKSEARDNFGNRTPPLFVRVKPPQTAFTTGAPFDGRSTTRTDFSAYPGARPASAYKPTVSVLDGPENRDFRSENRDQFLPKKAEPAVAKRDLRMGTLGPEDRDFKTENRANMADHGYVKREPYRPPQTTTASHPFDGRSTTREDFKKWDARPASSMKPREIRTADPDNRDFRTTMGDFKAHKITICPSTTLKDRHFKEKPGHKFYVSEDGKQRWIPETEWLTMRSSR